MKVAVIDTSALLRLFIPDGPVPAGLEDLVASASRSDAVLLAPGTALAESGQVLRKKERAGLLSTEDADEILAAILELPLDVVSDRDLVTEALRIARELGLTVYDALFFALAKRKHADLITADHDLAKAWRKSRQAA
jgi:predicted nucleic acid-binding protein